MGRELRMVPADWEHPKDESGRYIPLLAGSYREEAAEWDEENAQWDEGFKRDYSLADNPWTPRQPEDGRCFVEWHGPRPVESEYMPNWPESERTHFQMYEDTSEGTPISPVFSTAEELARWLADTGASAFADTTATYEQWMVTIRRGWAVSLVGTASGLVSGVTGMSKEAPNG